MYDLKNVLYNICIVAIFIVSMVIDWHFFSSGMQNEILKGFTITLHFGILLFNFIIAKEYISESYKDEIIFEPICYTYIAFGVISPFIYFFLKKNDADLFLQTGYLVCISCFILIKSIKYNTQREAERSKGEA